MTYPQTGAFGPFAAPDVPPQVYGLGGNTFYVNSGKGRAEDANDPFPEIDEALCFSTLQGAIDATVADRGDLIIVKRRYTAITTGVNFNKQGITVVGQNFGMPPLYRGEYFAQDCSATDGPAFTITKPCTIIGLGFHSSWVGGISSIGLIEWASGDAGWVHLKHCRFMNWATANVYGLNFEAGANCVIEECSFEGNATQGFVNAAIAFGGSATQNPIRNIVRNCVFSNCTYAIEHKDGTPQEFIYGPGNITVPATVATKFLNSKGAACTGIICGNFFYTAEGASTFDQTVANMETDGARCVGNEYETEGPGPT
jgi:hypothetical protein